MENLIIIPLEILLFFLSAYLIYYVHKKGQNQADKEDLKKLTEIVEEVKLKNSKEVESIKANLSLLTDRGKQIFSEEKDSIIVFFAQLNTWIWVSLNITTNDYNTGNFNDISKRLIEMEEAYNKTNMSYSKVVLLINNIDLINEGQEAINKLYEVQKLRIRLLNKLYTNCLVMNNWDEEISKINKDDIRQQSDLHSLLDASFNLEKQTKSIKSDYIEFNTVAFNSALDAINIFKDSAQRYLRKESPTN